ncbi:myb family transcription factor EFM-like [Iris pallida]|uniref:Myb family transcription factor EFM-like n=1 Tax=Iris pallida TaxID=29817 RepID=A0AAX6EIF0_IRIPA|nr:myb family transcription factor EFM-like [Iris pallida]
MAPVLGLDLKLFTAARIIGNLSKDSDQQTCRISRLQQLIGSLEEEQRKIEVFKRELPLCMYLLDDVILASKEEVEQWKKEKQLMAKEVKVDEQEKKIEMKLEKDSKEKMNWMSTAQLWTNNHDDSKIDNKSGAESKGMLENPETKKKTAAGGTFVRKDDGRSLDLSLVPVAVGDDARWPGPEPTASCHVSIPSSSSQQQQAPQRKARRCWSPDLHRRFLAALRQLGGAQVATPKQIRELMKVDGLTNDEVKSHLQKYRIHTRGMPSRGAGSHGVMVAMGGLWAEPESHSSSGGSPQGPLQLSGSSRTISVTAGESCEDDSRSEGNNWK